jgi:hypothetical protein
MAEELTVYTPEQWEAHFWSTQWKVPVPKSSRGAHWQWFLCPECGERTQHGYSIGPDEEKDIIQHFQCGCSIRVWDGADRG